MSQPEPQRLRATRKEIDECLDALDDASGMSAANHRVHHRRNFRIQTAEIHLTGPGKDQRFFLAATRNISRIGIAVILPQFVHNDSIVSVRIPWPNSPADITEVAGRVVRCRYLSGTRCLHEVGISFDRPISISGLEDSISARLLTVISDNQELPSVLTELMHPLKVDFTQVNSSDEIAFHSDEPLPLAYLIDFDTNGLVANKTVRHLRHERPEVPIIALITPNAEVTHHGCYSMGCDAIINRPLSRTEVAAALKRISSPPTLDHVANRDEVLRIIERFLAGMPRRLNSIDTALRGNDIAALEKLIIDTRYGASEAGFEVISRVATELEDSLHRGIESAETRQQLNELARLCMAVSPLTEDGKYSDGTSFGGEDHPGNDDSSGENDQSNGDDVK